MKKFFTFLLLATITVKLAAHGIHVEPSFAPPSVVVFSGYSETQPMKGASVKVYSPADLSVPFQTGTTDMNGKFSFVPDIAGEWIFSVDDQKGHMEKASVAVAPLFINPAADTLVTMQQAKAPVEELAAEHTHEHEIPLGYKIITGLSLIFGITGIFYGLRSKKS